MSAAPVALMAALADETRWSVLEEVSRAALSASELAERMPVSRQAIAKHLGVLERAGLVERTAAARGIRYRALGAELSALGRRLDEIGAEWDRRLDEIRRIAESL